MAKTGKTQCSQSMLRIALGLLFLIPGLFKIFNIGGVQGMLGGIAVFAWGAGFLAWILAIAEIIFGGMLLAGFKTRISAWVLFTIMLLATLTAQLPGVFGALGNMGVWPPFLLHVTALAALYVIVEKGPGSYAVDKA